MDKLLSYSFALFILISVIITTIAIIILRQNGYKNYFFIDKKLFVNFRELAKNKTKYIPFFYLLCFSTIAPIIIFVCFWIFAIFTTR